MSRSRFLAGAAAIALPLALVGVTAAPASAGVSGPAFFVDHEWYRTVATPALLSGTGAPDSSFDTIYSFGDLQPSVADSAPGHPGYNGGRWQVRAVAVSSYPDALAVGDLDDDGVLDSVEEVHAALDSEYASDEGIVKKFVCTVNPLPQGPR